MAWAWGPCIQGVSRMGVGRMPVARSRAVNLGSGADLVGGQDPFAPGGDRRPGAAASVAAGPDERVVVADEAGDVVGEVGVVDAGADEFDGGGGEQFVHPGFAPDASALGAGLQDGHRDDAAGSEVGVQAGEFGDPADVRGLVQDGDQGRVEAAGGGVFGGADGVEEEPVGERGDQGGGGSGAVLGQQVQALPGADERGGVEQVQARAVG